MALQFLKSDGTILHASESQSSLMVLYTVEDVCGSSSRTGSGFLKVAPSVAHGLGNLAFDVPVDDSLLGPTTLHLSLQWVGEGATSTQRASQEQTTRAKSAAFRAATWVRATTDQTSRNAAVSGSAVVGGVDLTRGQTGTGSVGIASHQSFAFSRLRTPSPRPRRRLRH